MSNSSTPPYSNGITLRFLADQFARGFQELRDAVNNIQTQVQAGAIDMAGVKAEISNMQDKVDELQVLVRGSNDSSLTSKLHTIEKELKLINEWVINQKAIKSESSKNKLAIKVAVITGSFALLAQIVMQIIHWFN